MKAGGVLTATAAPLPTRSPKGDDTFLHAAEEENGRLMHAHTDNSRGYASYIERHFHRITIGGAVAVDPVDFPVARRMS